MTDPDEARRKVLAIYPLARSSEWSYPDNSRRWFRIDDNYMGAVISDDYCKTEAAAWLSAAKRIEQ